MILILQREEQTKDGLFGHIIVGLDKFITLELPWEDNQKNISCIPAGKYSCKYTWSTRFNRRHYLVSGVPDRAGIRIHPANTASQLNGCIALGLGIGDFKGKKGVTNSRKAVGIFETLTEMKPFELIVLDKGAPLNVG